MRDHFRALAVVLVVRVRDAVLHRTASPGDVGAIDQRHLLRQFCKRARPSRAEPMGVSLLVSLMVSALSKRAK
jgi:hypothetical protein